MHRKFILPVVLSLVVVSAGWSYLYADESATVTDKVHSESVAPQPATTNTDINNDSMMQDESVIQNNEDFDKAPLQDQELANHELDTAIPQPAVVDGGAVVPHDQPSDVKGGVVPKSDDTTKDVIHHDSKMDKSSDVQIPAPAKVDEPATGVQQETGIHQDGTLAEADDQATLVHPAETVKKAEDATKGVPSLPVCTETGQENCIAPSVVPAPAPTKEEDHLAQATMTPAQEAAPVAPLQTKPIVHPAVAEPIAPPPTTSTPSAINHTGVSTEPGQNGLYMDRLKKFTVQFPETWEVKPGMAGMDVVGISPLEGPNDTFRENVNVASQVLQSPIKMTDFYTQGKKALSEQLPAFKELAVGDTNVNGLSVHWIEFSQASNNVQANIKQYYILSKDGSRAYIITGAAPPEKFDGFKATMDKIVQSFKAEN